MTIADVILQEYPRLNAEQKAIRHAAENSIFGDFRQSDNVPFVAQEVFIN